MSKNEMNVGRIVASVTIENAADVSNVLRCEALVDTGASLMVLPSAWKERLGHLEASSQIEVGTATQETVTAEVCGTGAHTDRRLPTDLQRGSLCGNESGRW